jgi:hypothetical protein
MISVVESGGTVTNFSPRFSLSGMTGTFPANVLAGINSVSGTAGPAKTVATAGDKVDPAGFGEPYSQQTGPIIYAPMQSFPGTKITKAKPTPRYPTSAYTIATTYLPANNAIQKTVTQAVTLMYSQMENQASAAGMPGDDMAKFLNRWKD